jgi:hypothetical protein
MFSKEEARLLNVNFWNGFEDYMGKTRSVNGRKIKWLNYPSDVKTIFVRLEADPKGVRLCFDIQHKDDALRAILWEQMTELQNVLEVATVMKAEWLENYRYMDQYISRIVWERKGLNYYKPEQHMEIFQFLKERLIKFDLFYQEYKDILVALAN